MLLTLHIPVRPGHATRQQKSQSPVLPTTDFDKATATLAKGIKLREYTLPLSPLNLSVVSITLCWWVRCSFSRFPWRWSKEEAAQTNGLDSLSTLNLMYHLQQIRTLHRFKWVLDVFSTELISQEFTVAQKGQKERTRTEEMLFTLVSCSGTFLPPQAWISQQNHWNDKNNSYFSVALLNYAALELLYVNGNVKNDL